MAASDSVWITTEHSYNKNCGYIMLCSTTQNSDITLLGLQTNVERRKFRHSVQQTRYTPNDIFLVCSSSDGWVFPVTEETWMGYTAETKRRHIVDVVVTLRGFHSHSCGFVLFLIPSCANRTERGHWFFVWFVEKFVVARIAFGILFAA